jgi:hypothetical protein
VEGPFVMVRCMVPTRIFKGVAGLLTVALLAVSPVQAMSRKPPEPAFIPGRIIVSFHESVSDARSAEIVQGEGAVIKSVLERTRLYLILLPEGMEVGEAVERFLKYPEVLSAEPDYRAGRLEDK